jgi:hypothetical protein
LVPVQAADPGVEQEDRAQSRGSKLLLGQIRIVISFFQVSVALVNAGWPWSS